MHYALRTLFGFLFCVAFVTLYCRVFRVNSKFSFQLTAFSTHETRKIVSYRLAVLTMHTLYFIDENIYLTLGKREIFDLESCVGFNYVHKILKNDRFSSPMLCLSKIPVYYSLTLNELVFKRVYN